MLQIVKPSKFFLCNGPAEKINRFVEFGGVEQVGEENGSDFKKKS